MLKWCFTKCFVRGAGLRNITCKYYYFPGIYNQAMKICFQKTSINNSISCVLCTDFWQGCWRAGADETFYNVVRSGLTNFYMANVINRFFLLLRKKNGQEHAWIHQQVIFIFTVWDAVVILMWGGRVWSVEPSDWILSPSKSNHWIYVLSHMVTIIQPYLVRDDRVCLALQ